MPIIRITKIFEFEMAHALWGYEGPCKNVHGHSYKLFVTVSGKIKENSSIAGESMVIDFSELKNLVTKNIISKFDHALVLDGNVPEDFKKSVKTISGKIVYVLGMPTCEALVMHFASILKNKFPPGINLHYLKLQETATSYAEWTAEDNG